MVTHVDVCECVLVSTSSPPNRASERVPTHMITREIVFRQQILIAQVRHSHRTCANRHILLLRVVLLIISHNADRIVCCGVCGMCGAFACGVSAIYIALTHTRDQTDPRSTCVDICAASRRAERMCVTSSVTSTPEIRHTHSHTPAVRPTHVRGDRRSASLCTAHMVNSRYINIVSACASAFSHTHALTLPIFALRCALRSSHMQAQRIAQ